MTQWLTAEQVAERLSVSRKTALCLMNQMPHSVIGGTVRKRIRVSETDLDSWMVKRSNGSTVKAVQTGCNRRLGRR